VSVFRPKASVRARDGSGHDLYFYELFLAEGPAIIGDTGAGDLATLFGANWITLIDRDGATLRAFKEGPLGTWTEVTAGLPTSFGSALPSTARRLSHAFDQAARIIVAWEDGGTITATRWDQVGGAYVSDVAFAGVNPCLLMQATVDAVVGGSDIWLFYQRDDAPGEVFYRLQRDSYGVEYSLFSDASIAILDRAVALPYRFELWVSDQYGTPLQALISDYYPVPASDTFMDQLSPRWANYIQEALAHAQTEPAHIALGVRPVDGRLTSDTFFEAPPGESLTMALAPTGAESVSDLKAYVAANESVVYDLAPVIASYVAPIIRYAAPADGLLLALTPEGAEYHATV